MPAPDLDAYLGFYLPGVFLSSAFQVQGAKLVSQETCATACSQFIQTQR